MTAICNRVVLSFLATSLACWAGECVPSGHRARPSVLSPDGRYKVLNVLCSSPADDKRAVLVLLNVKSGVRRTLYPYTRDATVVWSPDSQRFAINDYAGSNYTNNLVYSVDPKEPPVDLQKQMDLGGLPEPGRKIQEVDHLYYSVINWRSANEVKLLAWGHGGQPSRSFCWCLLLTLDGKARRCRVHASGADPEDYCGRISK